MKGCAHAANRDYELAIVTAWHGEAFTRAKKLKNLSEYLPREEGEAQSVQPELVLDAMMTLQAHGVPMEIRKVSS